MLQWFIHSFLHSAMWAFRTFQAFLRAKQAKNPVLYSLWSSWKIIQILYSYNPRHLLEKRTGFCRNISIPLEQFPRQLTWMTCHCISLVFSQDEMWIMKRSFTDEGAVGEVIQLKRSVGPRGAVKAGWRTEWAVGQESVDEWVHWWEMTLKS